MQMSLINRVLKSWKNQKTIFFKIRKRFSPKSENDFLKSENDFLQNQKTIFSKIRKQFSSKSVTLK